MTKHTDTSRSGDLVERLRAFDYNVDIATFYDEDPECVFEAANEIKRLCGILEQWLNTAREHLDTEVAGRTFEALRKNSHD